MTIQERYEGLQTLALALHEEGCHFLTLCSIADEWRAEHRKPYIDLIEAIRLCQSKGYLKEGFYVYDDGTHVLSLLTNGQKWSRRDVEALPVIRDNDYTEAIYFNPRTDFKHFRRRYFDTLSSSVTVREGYIVGYRIYTAVK